MPATAAELVAGIFDSEAEGVAGLQAAADAHAASPAGARELYAEPFFPADSRALFRDADRPTAGHAPLEMVEWRRAAAICSDVIPSSSGFRRPLFSPSMERIFARHLQVEHRSPFLPKQWPVRSWYAQVRRPASQPRSFSASAAEPRATSSCSDRVRSKWGGAAISLAAP